MQALDFKMAKEPVIDATEVVVVGTFITSASDAVSGQSFTVAYFATV